MTVETHITTRAAWDEWKRRCAADLCGEDAAALLRRFGAARFATYVSRFSGHSGERARSSDAAHGWHLLETYARVAGNRAGKRYKDWLFERADRAGADGWLSAVESGATVLMRDAVREHLRREYSPAFMVSLHKPVGGMESPPLEELLPGGLDPADAATEKEWEVLAGNLARQFEPDLDSLERIAIWARANGFTLTDDRVLAWCRCSEATLYARHRSCITRLAGMIRVQHADEAPAALISMCSRVLHRLGEIIDSKIMLEKRATRFFKSL